MPSRREQIESMLADDPGDTFLRYGLAMELRKEGRLEESVARLAELTAEAPPYVPAFLMTAQQLVELNRVEDARAVLREGIESAREQDDAHAAGEMGDLLAELGRSS